MLKKILRFGIILFCTATCTLHLISPASALEPGDIVLQVQPASQDVELFPGLTTTGSLTVRNVGRLPFSVKILVRPYQALNENYDPDFVTENNYTKLINWIKIEQDNYTLEPGTEQEIYFSITVPQDIPGGGQYAALMIETHDTVSENATMRITSQVASLIYAHVQGEEHIGGVVVANSIPNFLLGSPITASVTVKNDGNVDFRATHTMTIYDFFTNREAVTAETITPEGQTPGLAMPAILPETQRKDTLTWEGSPQLGIFRVVQKVAFLGQEESYEQVVILCPIWLAGSVIFLIVVMILWLIFRLRRRRRNRPQVF